MQYTVGFIGTGNMGAALARAAARALTPSELVLCDHIPEKARALAETLQCAHVQSPAEAAAQSRFLFLGVKPQMMGGLLRELRGTLAQAQEVRPVLVSMAAGLTLSTLTEMAEPQQPIIRIMPNTPVSEGAGVIVFACNSWVTNEDRAEFLRILSAAGTLRPLEESLMDAATSVAGCGPAFTCLFIDALADGAVACGLSREDALLFATQTVLGTATMLLASGKHPEVLKNEVCSPGGSTIQGVRVLEQRALRAACMDAVIAAFEKNKALGQQ